MATKKDLIAAQVFNRNRLISAFIGGAPAGKELEPAQPLRAVYSGLALSAMVILAGICIALLKPGLPGGWENNRLIVARDTGARYVSSAGVLHPIINTVSARMLIPAAEFSLLSVNQSALTGIPIGETIGILGAPETLPAAHALDGRNWMACSAQDSTEVWLGGQARIRAPAHSGVVVTRGGETFVISAGSSYAIAPGKETAVLRALGLESALKLPVRGDWLALFTSGSDLAPFSVPQSGQIAPGLNLPIGSVIHPIGAPANERYLLTAASALAPLSPLAYRLYLLSDSGATLGKTLEISPAEIAQLPTAKRAGGADWPENTLTPLASSGAPCATLSGAANSQRTTLANKTRVLSPPPADENGAIVHIRQNHGALVSTGRSDALVLIDSEGVAYQLPGKIAENAKQLGYSTKHITTVPGNWVRLLPAGPELTPEAAGASPEITAEIVAESAKSNEQ